MLIIKAKLPTANLPIRRVLVKLFQSFIYHTLDTKEHDGYKHANGKVFKAMNFKIVYIKDEIHIHYVSLEKENEKIIAQKILLEGLKLGEIHITQTELSLKNRHQEKESTIKVGGFVCANIKDGTSSQKIYLEPKSHKFQEIVHNNTLEKYEALFKKPYAGELKIKVINQKPKERIFHYSKGVMKAWYGVYAIEASSDMLGMILDTGMGANCMKGLGFLEVLS
ncbi:MAG: CRISPR-associated endoribonuclease Cas6 [Campylobacterota bacterium]|nr:CRISPR-associated endoribonuclease Cas6 [Campylobacterota bacterium]